MLYHGPIMELPNSQRTTEETPLVSFIIPELIPKHTVFDPDTVADEVHCENAFEMLSKLKKINTEIAK